MRVYIYMPNRRTNKRSRKRGGNGTCRKYDKQPFKCLTKDGCVYNSATGTCSSMDSNSKSTKDINLVRQEDRARNPVLYSNLAATEIQRQRRGRLGREVARAAQQKLNVEITNMDGSTSRLKIPASKTYKGFTKDISTSLGFPASNVRLMHPSLASPLTTMQHVRTVQAKDPDSIIRLFSIVEKPSPMELMSIVADSLEKQGSQQIRVKIIDENEEKADDDDDEPSGDNDVVEVSFRGNMSGMAGARNQFRLRPEDCVGKIVPPNELGELIEMQALYMVDLKITAIPDSISNLSNLTRIYFHHTSLKALPKSISTLPNLRKLQIKQSCLTNQGIPSQLGDLRNLETLDLTYPSRLVINDNNSLGVSLAKMTNLKHLDLSGCDLSDGLSTLSVDRLNTLRLNDARLNDIPDWAYFAPDLDLFEAADNNIRTFRSPHEIGEYDGHYGGIFPVLLSLDITDAFLDLNDEIIERVEQLHDRGDVDIIGFE